MLEKPGSPFGGRWSPLAVRHTLSAFEGTCVIARHRLPCAAQPSQDLGMAFAMSTSRYGAVAVRHTVAASCFLCCGALAAHCGVVRVQLSLVHSRCGTVAWLVKAARQGASSALIGLVMGQDWVFC